MSETVKIVVTLSKGQYEALKDIQFGGIGSRMIFNAVKNGIPLTKITSEIEELADFHSVKIPVRYGDGTQAEEKYIDLSELGIILREIEGNDEEE